MVVRVIDWTDRSQDVLARFEVWRNSPNKTAEQIAHADILMADLATMVKLTTSPADRHQAMQARDLETGARLFPDPEP